MKKCPGCKKPVCPKCLGYRPMCNNCYGKYDYFKIDEFQFYKKCFYDNLLKPYMIPDIANIVLQYLDN